MKALFQTIFFLLVTVNALWANALPSSDCDTLFTTDGKVFFVNVVTEDDKMAMFHRCDSLDTDRFTLPQSRISRIGYFIDPNETSLQAYKRDPIGRQARTALVLCIIGAAAFAILNIYAAPAIVFLIVGVIKGERVLRKLKQLKGYKYERKARKESRAAVFLGMIMFFIPIAMYILISFIL